MDNYMIGKTFLLNAKNKLQTLPTTNSLAKCGQTLRNINFLFCYCAAVVGRDGTLLIKKFYLEQPRYHLEGRLLNNCTYLRQQNKNHSGTGVLELRKKQRLTAKK